MLKHLSILLFCYVGGVPVLTSAKDLIEYFRPTPITDKLASDNRWPTPATTPFA